jgi:basic membrane protein A
MFTKKGFAVVLAFVLVLGSALFVTGCAPAQQEPAEAAQVGIMLSVGGRGDKSFNDAAIEGLERAKAELGIEFRYEEPGEVAAMEDILRFLAEQEMDLIISVGFLTADALTVVAQEFPDQKFAIIDSVVDLPNVASLVFKEHEGSFLAGALAALMSETGTVGFVGGMDIPLIQKFHAGFEHGVKHINETEGKNVSVVAAYAGTTGEAFRNPAKGKELALAHMDAGADIIYHASGGTGMGVFEAAVERDKLAIGVDSNQNWVAPGNIIASMLKRVDVAVFNVVKSVVDDAFAAGTNVFGVAQDGVGLTDLNEVTDVERAGVEEDAAKVAAIQELKDSIPDDVVSIIEDLKQQIIDGGIVVRDTLQ